MKAKKSRIIRIIDKLRKRSYKASKPPSQRTMKREQKKANAINSMRENLEKMKEEIITVPRLLEAIKAQDNGIENPSDFSLKRYLKKDLNYSYQ